MAFKGFEPGLICHGKQYAEHTLFEEADVIPCESGLHYCENPLEVLSHYPLINADGELNEFAVVFSGTKPFSIDGKKFCTGSLYVDKRLTLREFVLSAFQFKTRDAPKREGDRAWVASSAYAAQMASITNCAHIASASNYSRLVSSGRFDHLVTGGDNCSILSVGDNANIACSGECAQIVSEGENVSIVVSGKYPKIHAIGNYARINSSGDEAVIVTKGNNAVISATGRDSKVKGKIGSIITLTEWKYSLKLDKVIPYLSKTVTIDGEIIKENTFYTLHNGAFIEAGKENI